MCKQDVLPGYRHACDSAVSCRWCIYPCVLRDVSSVDMPTTVLGHRVSIPICVEATAMQRMEHPDDKTATVRGQTDLFLTCLSCDTGMKLSSWATSTIEEAAESLVRRAEEAGYKGIFVTVDTPYLGRRRDDVRNRFKLPSHLRVANFETPDLAFSSKEGYGKDSGLAVYVTQAIDATVKWDDITWLKRMTSLPVVVKGVLTAEDAKEALKYGVDGILVSNHGARQLDGVPATIDALPEVVEDVEGKVDALALGAKAVFVGRPLHKWRLTSGIVLYLFINSVCCPLAGCRSLKQVNRSLLRRSELISRI
uniref:Hydroxyacid oxidase (glycolate oxidase) 1 n=1 Tax=Cyprinus carpio TaxID=7962 RepID=A0A8C2Q4M2_CYPCA